MNSLTRVLLVALFVALPGEGLAEVQRAWPTMGTLAEVTLDTEPSDRAEAAVGEVRAIFERINTTMTVYDRYSDLNRVNRWAGFRGIGVDPWLARLVARGKEAQFVTDGAFRMSLLGEGIKRGLKPPLVNATPGRYGPQSITVSHTPPRVRLGRPGMGLDLGGVAKGFALDRAGERLRERGFERFVINLGRSLKLGDPPRGEAGWPVKLAGRERPERFSNLVLSNSRQGLRSDTDHVVVEGPTAETSAQRWVAVASRVGWVSDMASTALLADPSLRHRLTEHYPSIRWIEVGVLSEQEANP